jgi:uncharacterized repeat protein (TIGR03803 family)
MKHLSVALLAAATSSVLLLPISAFSAASEQVLYSFCSQQNCSDGGNPYAALIELKGILYGTTSAGGVYGVGAAFSVDPSDGAETVLHSFGYGTDGGFPLAGLVNVNGQLYGTTKSGGAANGGIAFAINPDSGGETIIYNFCSENNCIDGENPLGGLTVVSGKLYGTTEHGGSNCSCGTMFSLDIGTNSEKVLHSFCSENNCDDGSYPSTTLTKLNGMLYGSTSGENLNNSGVLFSFNITNQTESTIFSFDYSDGVSASSLLDVNGILYGMTSGGGMYGDGTIFRFDPSTNTETVLHSFHENGKDGWYPTGGLIYAKGKLYGTTNLGGRSSGYPPCKKNSAGCGTVFSIDLSTGKESVVYSFCSKKKCADGRYPVAGLLDVKGTLYGTTYEGGTHGAGSIFSITP